jgi:hypothetical protein
MNESLTKFYYKHFIKPVTLQEIANISIFTLAVKLSSILQVCLCSEYFNWLMKNRYLSSLYAVIIRIIIVH